MDEELREGTTRRLRAPAYERSADGETPRERTQRQSRNRLARQEWEAFTDARCLDCGQVRFHVSHEMDPATSPEGPEYHADFAHHPFREDEPSIWNEDPCSVCGGHLDRPHAHEDSAALRTALGED
jgi:hypothetical protein